MAEAEFTAVAESVVIVACYSLVYAALDQKRLSPAKDEAAADFYRKHGFEPIPDEPLKLFLPVPLSSG